MKGITLWVIAITLYLAGLAVLAYYNPTMTDERSVEPKLYCWYAAGYGKAVFDYESIGQGDIITDADDVFNMATCMKWRTYAKETE